MKVMRDKGKGREVKVLWVGSIELRCAGNQHPINELIRTIHASFKELPFYLKLMRESQRRTFCIVLHTQKVTWSG